MTAWHWRTVFATIAAVIFFGFAGAAVGALPEQTQIGCTDPASGTQYVSSVWAARICSQWHEPSNPGDTFVPVTNWAIYGQPLGVASGAHQLIFEGGLGVIAWFAAFGCLAVALAIPVNRSRAPGQAVPGP